MRADMELNNLKNTLTERFAEAFNRSSVLEQKQEYINAEFEKFSAKALDEWNRRQDHVTGIENQQERHGGALHIQAVAHDQLKRRVEGLENKLTGLSELQLHAEKVFQRQIDEVRLEMSRAKNDLWKNINPPEVLIINGTVYRKSEK